MNNSRLQRYLDFMKEQGLLDEVKRGSSTIYRRTDRGSQLLEQIDDLLQMLIEPEVGG